MCASPDVHTDGWDADLNDYQANDCEDQERHEDQDYSYDDMQADGPEGELS